jgi:hypothetical protein
MLCTNGHVKANEAGRHSLKEENKMKELNTTEIKTEEQSLETAQAAVETNSPNNVLTFTSTLRELRKNVDPELVRKREGWRDRYGNAHYVDYVEWHTVADILDETAADWSHSVKDIRQIGDVITVTVAITINGITREGIGTGAAGSELGIKKAEHDALKRAGVKFGIARDLYKKEYDAVEYDTALPHYEEFPANPIAKSLSDLVTAKQLGMIRAISREIGINADEECDALMQCKTDELSKRAASGLIRHLQDLRKQRDFAAAEPIRRAG